MNAVAATVSGLVCRHAERADLPRLLELLADDYGRLGFAASHEGFKRALGEPA